MARLRRSDPSGPGLHRRKSGTGFRFTDEAGDAVSPDDRARIDDLVIPPAWTEVWIAEQPNGHIQATGVDDAGRKQYIYHADWRRQKDKTKFDRAMSLAESLPAARRKVTRDLRGDDPKGRVLAVAFRMLDVGALRVGSERYTEDNGSHGLSTLLCAHVQVTGDVVTLGFPGKSGKTWSSQIDDPELAHELASLKKRGPTARLLAYENEGDWHPLAASDINDYVRECTGGSFTAKDFRTLRGTAAAALSLARHGAATTRTAHKRALAEAMREASIVLGNTPTIARKSYVDPRVVTRFTAGSTVDAAKPKSVESELQRLLG
jgi:DNA topoisomerase I